MTDFYYVLALVVLLFLSAWVSAAETALFSISPSKVKAYKTEHDTRKRLIAHLLAKSRDLLVTLFMLNTIINIVLQNTASSMFGQNASWVLTVGVPLVLTLVLGEIIPKYYGLQNNLKLSYSVAPMVNRLQNWLGPVRRAVVAITNPISRILFFFLKKEQEISPEELDHMLSESEKQGILSPDERHLISGYLDLQDKEVKELMWPRGDMIVYDIHQPLSKLTHLFVDQQCSRIPVIDKEIDNTLGVIDAVTFFKKQPSLKEVKALIPLLKKPFFVPETTQARQLLKKMNQSVMEFALVVDEYGSITGLLTREDLLEVVVGQIQDLRDQEVLYTKAGENAILASGKMELSEFNDLFHVNLESKNNLVSLGGWLTEKLGGIPKNGMKFELEGFLFQILLALPTHIEKLYVRKINKRKM